MQTMSNDALSTTLEDIAADHNRIATGEIESRLLEHPLVREAVVVSCPEEPPDKQLEVYVVADMVKLKALDRERDHLANSRLIDQWNKLYELTYSAGPAAPSFVGWNSSYTRKPIPEAEMQQWLLATVERIHALKPCKILEIGCGVGLLLQHLAPRCAEYVGTDFSAAALAQLSRWVSQRSDLRNVELVHRPAADPLDMENGRFDTVVLNSVVQYFPDVNYLLDVVREATRLVSPGGRIFIGDVRHRNSLAMFQSAVQLSRAADCVRVGQLRRRIVRAVAQETELLIDPLFFHALPGLLPGVSAANVQLRRGDAHNELTRYRYDVLLKIGESHQKSVICEPVRWQSTDGLPWVEAALKERRWRAIHLVSIPNRRLSNDAAARILIETSDEQLSAGAIRSALGETRKDWVDPELFWQWGDTHGYDVSVGWDLRDSPEFFEVRLADRERGEPLPGVHISAGEIGPLNTYANNPQENALGQKLILKLRESLRGKLSERNLPSAWTVLKQLPLASDGSVDRGALMAANFPI